MAFIESTTKIIRMGDAPGVPTVLLKDTVTIDDIVFLYARTAAASKLGKIPTPKTAQNIRQQITRAPYGR